MGNSSSRTSRTVQEVIDTAQASVSKQASRNAPAFQKSAGQVPSFANRNKSIPPEIREIKDKFIKGDSIDPDLLANLRDIGPVKVPKYSTAFKPGDQMLNIMRNRTEQDEQSFIPTRNKLPGEAIYALLQARQSIASRKELQTLCKSYNIDVQLVESLAQVVNPPVAERIEQDPKQVDEEGELYIAKWKDPQPLT